MCIYEKVGCEFQKLIFSIINMNGRETETEQLAQDQAKVMSDKHPRT